MEKIYFANIGGDLQLIVEYVFIEYERPILFLCKERQTKEKYLCLCYECWKVQKWVIAKVDEDIIYKMACGENSVRESFLDGQRWFLVEYNGTKEKNREIDFRELISNIKILPDQDVNLDEDERDEYLEFLANKYKKSIQKIVCDSRKILEGLSETMKVLLKEQDCFQGTNLRTINKISAELSQKKADISFGELGIEDVIWERRDTIYSETLEDNVKNVLEIDNFFSSAA